MKIEKTNVWKNLQVVKTILKESPVLDPLVIIYNSDLYLIKKGKEIASFLTLKKYFSIYELGTVYTYQEFRKKGFSKKLINSILLKHPEIYLICRPDKKKFYEKLGFRYAKNSPLIFLLRIKLWNALIFSDKNKLIVMQKTRM